MSESIRIFIAIELDDATRRALGSLQSKLKAELGLDAVRWVAPQNIHLTLKFIGDVDAMRGSVPALERAVADAGVGIAPFVLRLSGVGAFPNVTRPNNVWVGVQGEVEQAALLAKKIEDACAILGFPPERRPFEPHLTLGRVKRDAGTRERAEIAQMIAAAPTRELGQYRVEQVSLMKSELRPTGSVYSQLAFIKLSQTP